MVLTIDVGNSNIVLGVFENDDIKLILDDYQEIEDYTVFDVSDMVDEEEEERRRRRISKASSPSAAGRGV